MPATATGMRVLGLFVAALACGSASCGGNACGSNEASGGANAPLITRFSVANQLQGDPWTVVFAAEFRDADGNLGSGRGEFYLNSSSSPSTVQSLEEAFRQSAVPPNATQGTVALPLRFADSVRDGASVTLGLQLVDAASARSNCFALDLEFDVRRVTLGLWHGASRLAMLR